MTSRGSRLLKGHEALIATHFSDWWNSSLGNEYSDRSCAILAEFRFWARGYLRLKNAQLSFSRAVS